MKYFYGLQVWLYQTEFYREVLKEHTTKAREQMILEAGMEDRIGTGYCMYRFG